MSDLPGGDARTNAELFQLLLDDRAPVPLRQLVCLSASVALVAAGKANSHEDAYTIATELLTSGRTKAKYLDYCDAARECASN